MKITVQGLDNLEADIPKQIQATYLQIAKIGRYITLSRNILFSCSVKFL